MSHPCNDFIIKDRRFVRDFEGMYRAIKDPWDQSKKYADCLMNNTAFWHLGHVLSRDKRPVKRILDIGCAEGYYAEPLLLLKKNSEYVGIDISSTVIKRAYRKIPSALRHRVKFFADDIRVHREDFINSFDVVFSAKTLYYIAPEIDTVIANIVSYLKPGGVCIFTYNVSKDSFSTKWLTPQSLRNKFSRALVERMFIRMNERFSKEDFMIGIYIKDDVNG